MFRAWAPALADVVEVLAARPPGRETRLGEKAIPDALLIAGQATDALAEMLATQASRPYVLHGHSLGATVAFEVAREAARRGLPGPRALVVSGRRAPSLRAKRPPIGRLPHDEFIAELRELNGTPPGFFDHQELIALLLPMLRADFIAAEDYVPSAGPPIEVPIFAYGGLADEETPRSAIDAWQEHTRASFVSRFFEGGHFFIHGAMAEVFAALRKDLASVL